MNIRSAFAALLLVMTARPVQAQSYFNLDAGRPTRVEDASPTPRYELDFQLVPVRFEQFATGARRLRFDPKFSYGIAPFTELEVRAPFLHVDPRADGAERSTGLGGLGVTLLHVFGIETRHTPAFALATEWVTPVGSLAARTGSYSVKLIVTRTLTVGRLV